MYTVILDEGIVIRNVDQVIVAPCQSADDPDFRAYINWVMLEGNEPVTIQSRTVEA